MTRLQEVDSMHRGQLDIFDPSMYDHYGITIIGCGSIGSSVAYMLSKMGFRQMFLFDADNIEKHNVATQFFSTNDIGYNKAKRLATKLNEYSECKATGMPVMYNNKIPILSPVVIATTDNMESRKEVYEACKKYGVRLLIDARMGGEVFSVFTVNMTKPRAKSRYEGTFHKTVNNQCTSKGILYNIELISGIVGSQLVRVMKNERYDFDVSGSSKTLEIIKS